MGVHPRLGVEDRAEFYVNISNHICVWMVFPGQLSVVDASMVGGMSVGFFRDTDGPGLFEEEAAVDD